MTRSATASKPTPTEAPYPASPSFIVLAHALTVLTTQLPKTATLVEDSTQDLCERFLKLAQDSSEQAKQVNVVADAAGSIALDNGERITLNDFTNLFSETLYDSIEKILQVSKKSMEMVYRLDEAINSLSEIEKFLGDIQKINRQANLLALNATIEASKAGKAGESFQVVASEIKNMSNDIRELSVTMQDRINTISTSVNSGYELLRDVASTDMSTNMRAKETLDQLLSNMLSQNKDFTELLAGAAAFSENLSANISSMVMGMQFQDRTKQYVENSVRLLEWIITMFESGQIPVESELTEEIQQQFTLSEFTQLFCELAGLQPSLTATANDAQSADKPDDDIELF